MTDCSGESTDQRQPLSVRESLFHAFPLGHVMADRDVCDLAFEHERQRRDLDDAGRAVSRDDPAFARPRPFAIRVA